MLILCKLHMYLHFCSLHLVYTCKSQCSTVLLTLLLGRPAKPMENGKIGSVKIPKTLNCLSQNLTWLIMSAISSRILQFKAIAPVSES